MVFKAKPNFKYINTTYNKNTIVWIQLLSYIGIRQKNKSVKVVKTNSTTFFPGIYNISLMLSKLRNDGTLTYAYELIFNVVPISMGPRNVVTCFLRRVSKKLNNGNTSLEEYKSNINKNLKR